MARLMDGRLVAAQSTRIAVALRVVIEAVEAIAVGVEHRRLALASQTPSRTASWLPETRIVAPDGVRHALKVGHAAVLAIDVSTRGVVR